MASDESSEKEISYKLPIFNNHTCEGMYGLQIFPEHHAYISHLILGVVSILYPSLVYLFVLYQLMQITMKREFWDDTVDIIEFYIGRLFGFYIFGLQPTL